MKIQKHQGEKNTEESEEEWRFNKERKVVEGLGEGQGQEESKREG